MFELREYQARVVDGVRQSYLSGNKWPLVVVPTGGGKTIIFSYISKTSSERDKRVLVLVHRIELVRQTVDKLLWAGVRVGVIHPDFKPDYAAPVQVASVQALVRRLHKIHFDFDLIIVDEAHHATAGSWRKVIDHFGDARGLGVTATPCRTDGAGLNDMFDDLIVGPSVVELIEAGFLVKPVVYAPQNRLDFTGVKLRGGDYDSKEIELRVDKPSITGDAVAHYKRICPGAPAVAFCVSIAHAQHVAAEFTAAGFRAHSVDGTMNDADRKRILDGLGDGSVDVVCSCAIISEGTDIPAIAAAILLRPTASTGLYLQQVGRALRPLPGKEYAFILDHVGNCYEHGLPDDEREWSLQGVKKRRKKGELKTVKVRQCDKCYSVHRPAPTCPSCGYEYPVNAREIEQTEGELQALTPEMKIAIQKQRRREVAMAKDLKALIGIERDRGYKSGWARNVWAARNHKATGI